MGVMGTGAWAEPVAADITLQQQVTHLTQRVERLEALMEGSRRRMLLGETAVMLDKVAHTYVLGGARGHRRTETLSELRTPASHKELAPGELQRWQRFCDFMRQKGWPVSEACTTSSAIKDLCGEGERPDDAERQQVTVGQLQQWAATEMPADVAGDCQQFVLLVAQFGREGKPLLPVEDIAAVVDGSVTRAEDNCENFLHRR